MEVETCQFYIKRDKRCCHNKSKIEGYCTRHYNSLKKNSVSQTKQSEFKNNVPENTESKCPICLEVVEKKDDALLPCSYYHQGKGACVIHLNCAKELRNTECPTCRTPFQSTKRLDARSIRRRKEEDEEERWRQNNLFTMPDEMEEDEDELENQGMEFPQLIIFPENDEVEQMKNTAMESLLQFWQQGVLTACNATHEALHREFGEEYCMFYDFIIGEMIKFLLN